MTIDTAALRREAEEALELANKATPGEWIVLKAIDGLYPIAQVPFAREGYQWYTIEAGYPNRSSSKIDAEFIADSRTRVPSQAKLLKECADEIDRLREENKRLHTSLRGIGDMLFFPQSTIEGMRRTWDECYTVARAATGKEKTDEKTV